MNARITRRGLLSGAAALAAAPHAAAQGFAGLGAASGAFAQPDRQTRITFPDDHAPHPRFRIEWWYITANLTTADGRECGVQWTLFRSAFSPGGTQAWMGHAALTTAEAHYPAERLARGDLGLAGVEVTPFDAWIDDWSMSGPDPREVRLRAAGENFAYDLQLDADGPFVLQGDAGYSVKSSEGQASHYYSQPFYLVSGRIMLPDGEAEVTGQAWMDREWSSQPLEGRQTGWDWFSLHLEGGHKLMGFQLRAGDETDFTASTWIEPDGTATAYPDGVFSVTPLATAQVEGREIPVRWRIRLPDRGFDVEAGALNDQAWMGLAFPYWEGPIGIAGSHGGRGYLEMTGYG